MNKIQMRNSVSLDELRDTSEMSIPAKWTEDSMIPLSVGFEYSCDVECN